MGPSAWSPIRLGSVCRKIGSGATPRGGSDVYLDRGLYALIRSQNIYNDGFHRDGLAFIGEEHAAELSNVEVLSDDVLLNITGDSVARCCQVDVSVLPARVNQHVAIIRPDPDKLDPRFLRYFFVGPQMQNKLLSWAGSGGTRNALTKVMIESFEVYVPKDVSEQRAIAHILGTLDDKIELNRRMNETLEAMARAIFKSWFIDFDPVRAKAAGRDPGLPKEITELFPDRLENSELGEIPKGWVVCCLGDVAKINYGNNLPAQSMLDSGVPVYGAAGIVGYYSEVMFSEPVILVTSRGSGSGTVHETDGPAFVTNNSFTVVPIEDWFSRHLLRWLLLNADIASFVTGSAQPQLTITNFERLKLPLPPKVVVTAFHAITDLLWAKEVVNRIDSRVLGALRDTLCPKLISGEFRVNAVEQVEGAL